MLPVNQMKCVTSFNAHANLLASCRIGFKSKPKIDGWCRTWRPGTHGPGIQVNEASGKSSIESPFEKRVFSGDSCVFEHI